MKQVQEDNTEAKKAEEDQRLNRLLEILLEADLKIMEQLLKNNNY